VPRPRRDGSGRNGSSADKELTDTFHATPPGIFRLAVASHTNSLTPFHEERAGDQPTLRGEAVRADLRDREILTSSSHLTVAENIRHGLTDVKKKAPACALVSEGFQ